jgi:predicted PurR-regulated permease PerM
MGVLALALALATLAVIAPLWAPLVLAAWFADLLSPAVVRIDRLLGGRRRAAGVVIVVLVVAVLLPVGAVVASLASATRGLLAQVYAALEGQGSLGGALLGGSGSESGVDWPSLASRFGSNAWSTLGTIARASAKAAIGIFVFLAGLYTFTVDHKKAYLWLEEHAPISREELKRLAGAFRETGRGLILAGGGTALIQGALATIGYLLIGIPRALLLGPLTLVCALIPFVGTALVWLPIALELAATGQYGKAALMLALGGAVSTIDNFVRPFLTRYGKLQLPTFVVLIAMLGGVAAFGPTGALLGPLLVRLSLESLSILAARRAQPV